MECLTIVISYKKYNLYGAQIGEHELTGIFLENPWTLCSVAYIKKIVTIFGDWLHTFKLLR